MTRWSEADARSARCYLCGGVDPNDTVYVGQFPPCRSCERGIMVRPGGGAAAREYEAARVAHWAEGTRCRKPVMTGECMRPADHDGACSAERWQ